MSILTIRKSNTFYIRKSNKRSELLMRERNETSIIDLKSFIGRSLLSLLILSVMNRENACTGYSLIKTIKKMTDGNLELKAGTVYPVLESLKENNLITKEVEKTENRTKNGFRTRSVYRITNVGTKILWEEWEKWEEVKRIMTTFTLKEEVR